MQPITRLHESTKATVSPFEDCIIETDKYLVKLASNKSEIEQALRLRFTVFNLELGVGTYYSYFNGMDEDEYDKYCQHILVIDKPTKQVIGTYRLQDYKTAEYNIGFYCNREFSIELFPAQILLNSIEVGRACIAKEHRKSRVLYLLWKGIAGYLKKYERRYLFGSCSLHTQNEQEAWQVYNYLKEQNFIHTNIQIPPIQVYTCKHMVHTQTITKPDIPGLLQLYLNIGAKVCSLPAKDRDFKTIDFLILLDVQQINSQTKALFFQ